MAYILVLAKPRCRTCKASCSHEVFNRFNESCGRYCAKHAKQRLKELCEAERVPMAVDL